MKTFKLDNPFVIALLVEEFDIKFNEFDYFYREVENHLPHNSKKYLYNERLFRSIQSALRNHEYVTVDKRYERVIDNITDDEIIAMMTNSL